MDTTGLEMGISTDGTSPEGGLQEKEQRSPGVETGEGVRKSGQEKAEEAAVGEDVSTRSNSSVPPNRSESVTGHLSLAQQSTSDDSSSTSCDQPEQVESDSGTGTGTGYQENSWKNSEKSSVVLASSHPNPYPGIAVSQPEARATNERAARDENLTRSRPCNDESGGTRTSSNFNSSLGNSGNHPSPTTNPVECSDSTIS
jgi:hypothetical protein